MLAILDLHNRMRTCYPFDTFSDNSVINYFLSDYMGFMKKALILLKSYTLIKRVELEVEEVKDSDGTQTVPPISQ